MRVGEIEVFGISDGTFVARPSYFGDPTSMTPHPKFFDRDGAAWLPIGCFLVRTPGSLILVDAGLGPEAQHLPDGMMLVGVQLLAGLYSHGVSPADIDIVVCTHGHSDHVGWLFTLESEPVFSSATIWIGQEDLDAIDDGALESAEHIRRGLKVASGSGRIVAMSGEVEIAPFVIARPAPGHTLGHYLIDVDSLDQRLLLVGDAITCPIQLREPAWHSFGDVDPALGHSTRSAIWDWLRIEQVSAVGSHFPNLRSGGISEGDKWVEGGFGGYGYAAETKSPGGSRNPRRVIRLTRLGTR